MVRTKVITTQQKPADNQKPQAKPTPPPQKHKDDHSEEEDVIFIGIRKITPQPPQKGSGSK